MSRLPIFQLTVLCFIFFCKTSFSQLNLVKNPEFDIKTAPDSLSCQNFVHICDGTQIPLCYYPYLVNWFNPLPNISSPDYYYFEERIGLILHPPPGLSNYREFLSTQLTKYLNPDKIYRINVKFSFRGCDSLAVNRFGVYFGTDSIYSNDFNTLLNKKPQIEVDSNRFYDSIHVLDTIYVPSQPNERFLYIGNFYSDSKTKVKNLQSNWIYESYYNIDYVNVIEIDTNTYYLKQVNNDTLICEGTSVQLSSIASRYWRNYSWYTGDGFVSNNLNVTVSPKQTTTYYLYTTDTIHAPHTRLDSVTVTVLPFNVTLTDKNITLCGGDTVLLENMPKSGYNYKWQPAQYLSSDTFAQPYIQLPWYLESETINYTVTVTNNSNNCSDNFKYNVVVNFCPDSLEPQIYIPNVFSPNGDGENDEFKLSTQNIKDLKAEVYNRWGIRVNSFSGVNGVWFGKTIAGDNALAGIYYVIITAEGMDKKTYHYSGYVHLYH